MTYPNQNVDALEANSKGSNEYEILKAHALGCRLSQFDKRALTEYLNHADQMGTGVYLALSRLLRRKLKYAPDLIGNDPLDSVAIRGSRISFAIDKLRPQNGRLLSREFYQPGQDDISLASLLGATLIGMSAGESAPFLQADGSFRQVHLISVDYQPALHILEKQ